MLDALGRRLRFAPPQPKGEFIRITERDIATFEAINRHGPLPVHYLHEYAKGNLATLKRKVVPAHHGTTCDAPYLYRPEQQWASLEGQVPTQTSTTLRRALSPSSPSGRPAQQPHRPLPSSLHGGDGQRLNRDRGNAEGPHLRRPLAASRA